MAVTVKEIADLIKGEVIGEGRTEITGVAGIEDAEKGEITFADNPKLKEQIRMTKASCIITSFDVEGFDKPVIKCKNPSLAVTKIIETTFPHKISHPHGIAKSASIAKDVKLGRDIAIGANAVIEDGALISDGAVIYPLVYIGKGSRIGKNTIIYPNVTIRERVIVGDNVIIHAGAVIGADGFGFLRDGAVLRKIPQMGTVEIGDNVEIGACVTIDRARFGKTVIGKGTKIDNLVQIAHNVKVGENCIIVAQVGISGSVLMGNNVVLGGQAGITEHVEIGDNVMVAAKCGVTKSVPPNTIMSGIPARPHNLHKRLIAYIDNLPKMSKKLNEIEDKLKDLLNK
jgi:UDP-3-O-[3-hydroxymyristoyl] glucosamine N-acyltransferase